MKIALKRVYAAPGKGDGCRVLVDRLWPRGLSKKSARVDRWIRDVAPSAVLRKWFAHDPARWTEFKKRYFREFKKNAEGVKQIQALAKQGTVTLLFGARDEQHNNAVALKQYLGR